MRDIFCLLLHASLFLFPSFLGLWPSNCLPYKYQTPSLFCYKTERKSWVPWKWVQHNWKMSSLFGKDVGMEPYRHPWSVWLLQGLQQTHLEYYGSQWQFGKWVLTWFQEGTNHEYLENESSIIEKCHLFLGRMLVWNPTAIHDQCGFCRVFSKPIWSIMAVSDNLGNECWLGSKKVQIAKIRDGRWKTVEPFSLCRKTMEPGRVLSNSLIKNMSRCAEQWCNTVNQTFLWHKWRPIVLLN